jgi:ABC-type polysaccharide/polyol phosphate transport system ATPase subunit
VTVRDEVFPMLELGVGFQRDFSVRDNIYLYGSLFGFSRKDMKSRVEEILDFAELTRFADARFDKLSSGMQTRLGFAIAVQSVSPIVLVDEVLAVGDKPFKEKCIGVFKKFQSEGRTILLVSHDTGAIKEFCKRVFILDQGRLVAEGNPDEMITFYNEKVLRATASVPAAAP